MAARRLPVSRHGARLRGARLAMAKPAEYEVPPAPLPGARDEWEQLIATLHRTGALRVLNGFFGRLGAVSGVAFDGLNSAPGRNAIGVVLGAGQVAAEIPAKRTERVARGAIEGIERSQHIARPPGLWRLLRLLFAADTRRAIGSLLIVLNRIGGAMRHPPPPDRQG